MPGKSHGQRSLAGYSPWGCRRVRHDLAAAATYRGGFPGGSVVKNLPAMQESWFNPWVRKMPWRRTWQSTPVFLTEESHGQRSLVGYSPWDHEELDTIEVT